jgi:hypothetical protein
MPPLNPHTQYHQPPVTNDMYDSRHRQPHHMEMHYGDVQIPPMQTVVMPTHLLSSPIHTPLQMPGHPEHFPEVLALGGDYEERPPISSQEYSRLLERQISYQSSRETSTNPQFSKLYHIAQMPKMKKKIQLILSKKDIPKSMFCSDRFCPLYSRSSLMYVFFTSVTIYACTVHMCLVSMSVSLVVFWRLLLGRMDL